MVQSSMSDQKNREPDSGYERLEAQIKWYDGKSGQAQWRYKITKIVEFVCVAGIPLTAHYSALLTATFGAVVFFLEGIQQLFQWHHLWITYRATCEGLRHEKYSYLGRTGEYEGLDDSEAKKTLVERVESLVSTEHSKWISKRLSNEKKDTKR